MNPNGPFTPQEWSLITKVMDTVDELRTATPAPLDTARVKALVLDTYAHSGIPVDERLVDQALAISTQAFPVAVASAPTVPEPWWRQDLGHAEPELPPMEKAQRWATALSHHTLRTQAEIHSLVQDAQDQVLAAHAQYLRHVQNRILAWMGLGLTGVISGFFLLRVTPLAGSLICFSMMPLILPRIGAQHKVSYYLDTPRKRAKEAVQALLRMNTDDYALSHVLGKRINGLKDYNPHILTDKTEDQWEWKWANDAACQDPLLAQVWRRWLESSLPIRKGDVALLKATAEAIRAAKEWMVLHQEPVSLQQGMRQKLLNNLDLA